MTRTSTGAVVDANFRPSCSWSTVKIDGSDGRSTGSDVPGGGGGGPSSADMSNSPSKYPLSPVRSSTTRRTVGVRKAAKVSMLKPRKAIVGCPDDAADRGAGPIQSQGGGPSG